MEQGGGQKERGRLGLGREEFFFSFVGERADQRSEGTRPSATGTESLQLCVLLKSVRRLALASWSRSQAKRLRLEQRPGLVSLPILLLGGFQLFQKITGEFPCQPFS